MSHLCSVHNSMTSMIYNNTPSTLLCFDTNEFNCKQQHERSKHDTMITTTNSRQQTLSPQNFIPPAKTLAVKHFPTSPLLENLLSTYPTMERSERRSDWREALRGRHLPTKGPHGGGGRHRPPPAAPRADSSIGRHNWVGERRNPVFTRTERSERTTAGV